MSSDYSLAKLRQGFKDRGVFYTPPELALFLRSLIPGNPSRVYDPTCGRGNLLSVFPDEAEKYGQDIDAEAVADAGKALVNFTGATGDLFTDPHWLNERFDAIVANPPFSIAWEPINDERFAEAPTIPTAGRADYAFLLHILHMLADGGTAAVLSFPGVLYRGGREGQLRQWLVEQNVIDAVVHIPGDTFTDTAIATACIVLKKGRETTCIRFADNAHEIERVVPVEEVASNGYTLSVSAYVQPEQPEAPPVDAIALEAQARANALRKIRAEIEMSILVAELEGLSVFGFLDSIDDLVDEFRVTRIRQKALPMGEAA